MSNVVRFLHGKNDKEALERISMNGGVRVETYLLPDGTLVFLENQMEEGYEKVDLKIEIEKEEEKKDLYESIIEEWRNS